MVEPVVLRMLLEADLLQMEGSRPYDGYTPLLAVFARPHRLDCPSDGPPVQRAEAEAFEARRIECVRVLLESGASVDAVSCGQLGERDTSLTPLAAAQRGGHAVECVRLIAEAAALRYSPATHHLFPRAARAHSASMAILGAQLATRHLRQEQMGAFAEAWRSVVMPHLITRTSSMPVPAVGLPSLRLGDRVMVRGIVSRPELNGTVGEVCSGIDIKKRVGVCTHWDTGGVSLKLANLQRCDAHPRAAMMEPLVSLMRERIEHVRNQTPREAHFQLWNAVSALQRLAKDDAEKQAAICQAGGDVALAAIADRGDVFPELSRLAAQTLEILAVS